MYNDSVRHDNNLHALITYDVIEAEYNGVQCCKGRYNTENNSAY